MHRSIASAAAGNGPNGPSFEASLTTRSSPSSRCTSSTGFPGSYGTRSLTAGLKKLAEISANALLTDPTLPLCPSRAGQRRGRAETGLESARENEADDPAGACARGRRVPAARRAGGSARTVDDPCSYGRAVRRCGPAPAILGRDDPARADVVPRPRDR